MNRLWLALGLALVIIIAGPARAQDGSPADPPPVEGLPADGAAPDGTMPVEGSEGATELTTDVPSEDPSALTTDVPSEGATELTTDMPSEDATEVTTDVPSEDMPSEDPSVLTTEPPVEDPSESAMPLTTVSPDVVRPVPGEFSEAPSDPTTSGRGQAATFRIKFEPAPGVMRRLTESNSEQMKLVLPPPIENGPPEERSRLTTTTIMSTISFEAGAEAGAWKQAEVVQKYQRFEEGILMPDPLEPVLRGAKLVTKLDPNGAFLGVEDPAAFLAGLMQKAPEQTRPMIAAALSPEAIEHESRQGWQRKVGRYLAIPLRIGHPSFLVEYGELGEVGRLPYVLCAIPSTIEAVNGKQCVRVDLVSFSPSLKDGVLNGVPDEVDSEFMAWAEGKDIPYSPPELSVWGFGEVLLELNGTGTVRYRNEESFHLSPARINRPMGPPIEADELTIKRVAELTVE